MEEEQEKVKILKYVNTQVTFSELPDQITLCINISNCPIHCEGCHSKYLWRNIGEDLTDETLRELIENNKGITAICFMGGDVNYRLIEKLATYVRSNYPKLKIGWYSGRNVIPRLLRLQLFDYIKIGPYEKEKGGLSERTTNQRLFEVIESETLIDVTYKMWK